MSTSRSFGSGNGLALGEGHRGVQIGLDALADRADLGGREHAAAEHVLLEARDGVAGLPGRDLARPGASPGAGGPHGVEVPAIRLALEQARPVAAAGAGDRLPRRRLDLEHVVAVDDRRRACRRPPAWAAMSTRGCCTPTALLAAYWLFSQTKTTGSFHTAAMLSASWNSPSAAAPSPKKHTRHVALPLELGRQRRARRRSAARRRRCRWRPASPPRSRRCAWSRPCPCSSRPRGRTARPSCAGCRRPWRCSGRGRGACWSRGLVTVRLAHTPTATASWPT